ncbi:uncharacterized protein [Hoplias malabaricus]|uniref:uncharacterized protein n=1 Tax=Hoplias malabaricus TaxID=27720 RepID=UPI0034631AC4
MQSGRIPVYGHSHLFNSMQSYLCNHSRVQPIIGLGSVIELCTDGKPPVYLCEVCTLIINKTDIKTHIMGSLHRYNYIGQKSHHVYRLKAEADLTSKAWHLMELAKAVEKKEGTGNVQVLQLDEIIYKEIISRPVMDGVYLSVLLLLELCPPTPKHCFSLLLCFLLILLFLYILFNLFSVIAQVKELIQRYSSELQSNFCHKHAQCDNIHALSPAEKSPSAGLSSSSSSRGSRNDHPRQALSQTSRTLPKKEIQSPLKCQLQAEILHLNRDTAVQSSFRTIIQSKTIPSVFPGLTSPKSPLRDFSTGISPRASKRWSSIRDPGQNDFLQGNIAINRNKATGPSRCFGTEQLSQNTEQTTKRQRVANFQKSSQTMTINLQTNEEHNFLESRQEINNTLELMRTQSVAINMTPAVPLHQDIRQDDICIQELFRNAERSQQKQITAEQTSFGFESRYPATLSQYEEIQSISQIGTDHSSKLSAETPEMYSGKMPLIGLQAVIKCQSVDGDPPCFCYLCCTCSLKIMQHEIIYHLTSPQHQLSYISFHHPHLLLDMDITKDLHVIAMQLEQTEGRGQIKVMRLSACLFSEVMDRDYHWCIKMLNCGSADELKPNISLQGNRMCSGRSVILKRPNEAVGDPAVKPFLGQQRSRKTKVSCKKTQHKSPVFKVNLSLKAGPVVVDRMSLVTTSVAPEIEKQTPEALYRDNETFSEEYSTPENQHIHQDPETFLNMDLYPTEHLYSKDNTQSLGYTDAEMGPSTYGYTYQSHIPDTVMYSEQSLTGSLNRNQDSENSHGHVDNILFLEEASGSNTSRNWPTDRLRMESQPVINNICDWFTEENRVTHVNYWPTNNPMFVESEMTGLMFGDRNYEMMNLPMHTSTRNTEAYNTAIYAYTSYPASYVSQSWKQECTSYNSFFRPL